MWGFLLLATIFAFPQLLGILLYFRLSRAPRWLATIAGALAPAVIFFALAAIFLTAKSGEDANRPGCGLAALAVVVFLYGGTIVQLVLGVVTKMVLSATRRHRVAS